MSNPTSKKAKAFIDKHIPIVTDKYKKATLAFFNASISGKKEDYKKSADAQLEFAKIYTNTEDFDIITSFIQSEQIEDPILNRELEMLFLSYKANQVDKKKIEAIILLQNNIENQFSTFRPQINNKDISDNDIKSILTTSTDTDEVEKAWNASKEIGTLVSKDIIKLVKMRNEIAQELWYNNYHNMSLQLDEQDPEEIDKLFNELDKLTRKAFIEEKETIDEYLSNKFNIKKSQLMPWHYQNSFFQEGPKIYSISLDEYYKNKDLVELSRDYYNGIGLYTDEIISNSDLYEKDWKYQHAYCISIDKLNDVRIVCNIKPTLYRMTTQLHELGHAVYDKYIDNKNNSFLLNDPAHTFTTEAIAMMFGRFASNPQWIKDVLWISEDEKYNIADSCFKTLRLDQLVFSRWAQVMYHFEKQMYENPDQDLNKLRRDIVQEYQMIKAPTNRDNSDRAAKIHIATSPCYYHNYLLWELLASQIYHHIIEKVLNSSDHKFQSFHNKPEVGLYLKEKIFAPGRRHHWNKMIEIATEEKLTPKYYAQQFIHLT